MDYCLWKANCVILGENKQRVGVEQYICCCTCPKKRSCWCACQDRNGNKVCKEMRTLQELEEYLTPRAFSAEPSKPAKPPKPSKKETEEAAVRELLKTHTEKRGQVKRQEIKNIKKSGSMKTESKPTEKSGLWDIPQIPMPTTVKELAALTGATYARANYLINTKKMSYSEALKKLQEK